MRRAHDAFEDDRPGRPQAQAPPSLVPATGVPEPHGPVARLEFLCDRGSLRPLGIDTGSGREAAPVMAVEGAIEGRPVVCYAQDGSVAGGALGPAAADAIVGVLRAARERRVPVVGLVESAGARIQDGVAGMAGYARIFRESVALAAVAPQISLVAGTAAGGGAYAPALTDFVVTTPATRLFLTGPAIVRGILGEDVTAEALGGEGVHARNGVSHVAAASIAEALDAVRRLVVLLPREVGAAVARATPRDAVAGDPSDPLPARSREVYDIADVLARIVDGGELLEIAPRWGRNMLTAFARLDGLAVGVIANQPRHLGGMVDVAASEKGARFVNTCTRFGLPLLVFVDTPGFLPGRTQERAGVIRHGADLLRAFAAATVPRVTVVVRKAYGGAYITMNSKDLGALRSYAWPAAEIGIMDPHQAVAIVARRDIAGAADPPRRRAELAEAYRAEHVTARAAASGGFIDEVIAPADTRARLIRDLACNDRPGPR